MNSRTAGRRVYNPRMSLERKKEPAAAQQSAGKGGRHVTVHCHAGYKRDEQPRSFELDGRRLTVLAVKRTWKEEPAAGGVRRTCFKVRAHDGRTYLLALDDATGIWTLKSGEQRRGR